MAPAYDHLFSQSSQWLPERHLSLVINLDLAIHCQSIENLTIDGLKLREVPVIGLRRFNA